MWFFFFIDGKFQSINVQFMGTWRRWFYWELKNKRSSISRNWGVWNRLWWISIWERVLGNNLLRRRREKFLGVYNRQCWNKNERRFDGVGVINSTDRKICMRTTFGRLRWENLNLMNSSKVIEILWIKTSFGQKNSIEENWHTYTICKANCGMRCDCLLQCRNDSTKFIFVFFFCSFVRGHCTSSHERPTTFLTNLVLASGISNFRTILIEAKLFGMFLCCGLRTFAFSCWHFKIGKEQLLRILHWIVRPQRRLFVENLFRALHNLWWRGARNGIDDWTWSLWSYRWSE